MTDQSTFQSAYVTIDVSQIDLAGFESALALMGQSVMRSEAEALYDKFDADGNGMDEDEWIAFYANEILRPIDEDQVLDVFHDLWYAHAHACVCMCLHACACRTGGASLSLPNTRCLPAPAPYFFAPLPPSVPVSPRMTPSPEHSGRRHDEPFPPPVSGGGAAGSAEVSSSDGTPDELRARAPGQVRGREVVWL